LPHQVWEPWNWSYHCLATDCNGPSGKWLVKKTSILPPPQHDFPGTFEVQSEVIFDRNHPIYISTLTCGCPGAHFYFDFFFVHLGVLHLHFLLFNFDFEFYPTGDRPTLW
jgi:hypothetical protein